MVPPTLQPVIRLGKHTVLREVHTAAEQFGIGVRAFTTTLRQLSLPIISIGKGRYFSEVGLEMAFFMLSFFGGSDFATPGSISKNNSTVSSKLPDGFPNSTLLKQAVDIYLQLDRSKEKEIKTAIRDLLRSPLVRRSTPKRAAPNAQETETT